MANDWQKAKKQIKAFRDLINSTGGNNTDRKQAYCFVLTKKEIHDLLAQDEERVAGIRVYLAADTDNGKTTPAIYAVACEKVNDQYDDYNVPEEESTPTTKDLAPRSAGTTIISGGLPCPTNCPKSNALNS